MTARSAYHALLALALLAAALPALAGPRYPLTARSLARQIAARGAATVLNEVYDDARAWDEVTARIAAGRGEWLDVAEALLSVAEDPAGYDLEAAVGEALAIAPANVLAAAAEDREIALSWVCAKTATLEEDPSLEWLIGELEARRKAVASVRDVALKAKREACLAALVKARSDLERELAAATKKIG